jgi:hypothetical protein
MVYILRSNNNTEEITMKSDSVEANLSNIDSELDEEDS